MSYVNVKCKCNNEVLNSILAEAEQWVQNQDHWTPCMGATAPENCWPPKVLAYFAQYVYVVGPDVQCNPALTATGCDALSFCTTRTRRQPVALGWGLLLVLRSWVINISWLGWLSGFFLYSNSNIWYDPFKKLRPAENFWEASWRFPGGVSPPPGNMPGWNAVSVSRYFSNHNSKSSVVSSPPTAVPAYPRTPTHLSITTRRTIKVSIKSHYHSLLVQRHQTELNITSPVCRTAVCAV